MIDSELNAWENRLEAVSPPSLDLITLKAAMLVEGINFEPGAFETVGTTFKEQNHGLFGWDFIDHRDIQLPDDFVLSDGTVTQFRYNPLSPYRIEKREEEHVIVKSGKAFDTVKLIPRPQYYDSCTTRGAIMRQIAQVGGEDCFFICYQNYCSHFARGEQCLFCNLVSTKKTYDSVLTKKDIHDIGEVAAAAFAEGACKHILLTGGCFSHEKEVPLVANIVGAIQSSLGAREVPAPSCPWRPLTKTTYGSTGTLALAPSGTAWRSGTRRFTGESAPGRRGAFPTMSSSRPLRKPRASLVRGMFTVCSSWVWSHVEPCWRAFVRFQKWVPMWCPSSGVPTLVQVSRDIGRPRRSGTWIQSLRQPRSFTGLAFRVEPQTTATGVMATRYCTTHCG